MTVVNVGHADDALDIVQDAMLMLAQKYADKPEHEWPPLFFRILRNRTTDHLRRKAVKRRLFAWFDKDDDEADWTEATPAQTVSEPDHRARRDEFGQRLLVELRRLPARQRDTFMLRAWQGFDVKETAQAMGCSQGTVKTQYSRAVHALREQMQEFAHE